MDFSREDQNIDSDLIFDEFTKKDEGRSSLQMNNVLDSKGNQYQRQQLQDQQQPAQAQLQQSGMFQAQDFPGGLSLDIDNMVFQEDFNDAFITSGPNGNRNESGGDVDVGTGLLEIDESPPFTIELDLFFDPMNVDETTPQESKRTPGIFDYNTPQLAAFENQDQQLILLFQRNLQQLLQQQQHIHSNHLNLNLHLLQQHFLQQPQVHQNQQQLPSTSYNRASADNISHLSGAPNTLTGTYGSSFNELSPLTTVNSHTPSVSSMHSQQLSFFCSAVPYKKFN